MLNLHLPQQLEFTQTSLSDILGEIFSVLNHVQDSLACPLSTGTVDHQIEALHFISLLLNTEIQQEEGTSHIISTY